MADDQAPKKRDAARGADMAWTALGYLIAGMAFWGFVGWLIDKYWLHTRGIAVGVGVVVGTAAGIYLALKRLEAP
jgi:F0F1-type ATP synthase assembly protein I